MRSDIDHLPPTQQDELERVKQLLMAEFAEATARATAQWKKNGRILKIVLFGSYSRDDWVDEPANGYQSDFDLLVIVSHEDLTDIADYWYVAEDKIQRDDAIARPVNIIVHTLDDVNQALRRGEYFWTDIARDGITLYELPGSTLTAPMPLTSDDAYEMARAYSSTKLADLDRWLATVCFQIEQASNDPGFRKIAAFNLHQATETAYACFLLVRTLYFPRSHNIKFLRSLAEDKEPRLISAWERETRAGRRRFELVKRAYVEARYSASYEISAEDLSAIAASVRTLRDLVEQVSRERIGSARVQARNWRLMAFGGLALSTGMAAALIWQSLQSRVVPYVVEVDRLGEARAVSEAEAGFRPTDPQIAWHLARFIGNIRSVSLDPVLTRRDWLAAYDFATRRGALALGDYARAAKPFEGIGERMVSVQVTSVVRASERSFQVKWTETVFERGSEAGTSDWTGILTIVTRPPASADTLRKNPLGVYVDAIDWSRELEPTAPPTTGASVTTPTEPPPTGIPLGSPLDPNLAAQPVVPPAPEPQS